MDRFQALQDFEDRLAADCHDVVCVSTTLKNNLDIDEGPNGSVFRAAYEAGYNRGHHEGYDDCLFDFSVGEEEEED